jgi:Major intrinsic protein
MEYSLDRKLAVEFIGMFVFVFTVGMATQAANKSGAVLAPIAIGSVLMVMVFAGGHVSGGHFNPAVSTAVFLRGKLKANEYAAYVITQFVAAVAAGLVVNAVGGKEAAGATAATGKMLVVEFLFTFALAYTVLNVRELVLRARNRVDRDCRRDLSRLGLGRCVQPGDCTWRDRLWSVQVVPHLDLPACRPRRWRGRSRRVPLHTGRACQGGSGRLSEA